MESADDHAMGRSRADAGGVGSVGRARLDAVEAEPVSDRDLAPRFSNVPQIAHTVATDPRAIGNADDNRTYYNGDDRG